MSRDRRCVGWLSFLVPLMGTLAAIPVMGLPITPASDGTGTIVSRPKTLAIAPKK